MVQDDSKEILTEIKLVNKRLSNIESDIKNAREKLAKVERNTNYIELTKRVGKTEENIKTLKAAAGVY